MNTRRSFFEDVALLSALSALMEQEGYAQPQDQKLADFWDAYFTAAARDPNQVSRAPADGDLLDPTRKAQLLQATPDGLRYPDSIADSELTKETDVAVTVNPGHFRPAPTDRRAISRSKGCQIRLDFVQTQPIMNLIAPMAWSAIAAWSLEKTSYSSTTGTNLVTGKKTNVMKVNSPTMPDLKDLDFHDPNDPNAPLHNQVILMGGAGRMALNVRAVSQNSKLHAVLDRSVRYSSIIAPFFGFAPLALPALKTLTDLLDALFNHEAVIMNSMPLEILASQGAKKSPHDTDAMKVVSGDYIAVPANQTPTLKDALGKLRVVNGWLVHQDSKPDVPVETRAQDPLVPPVTYMSMSFTVQSVADAQKQKAKGA